MKVLFVYRFLTLGGVETVLRTRLERLPQLGVEAEAWFLADCGGRPIFAGIDDRVHIGPVEACIEHLFFDAFEIVCPIDTPELLAPLAAEIEPPPVVFESHTQYVDNLEYLRELDPESVHGIITPSEHQRRAVRERIAAGIEVCVVPNPLASAFLAEPVATPSACSPILAWIGRIDELKNWRLFLRIAAGATEAGFIEHVWLVGAPAEDDAERHLYALASELGLLPRLRWYRGLPYRSVPAFLDVVRDSGGVLASTSRSEAFGMTVVEAMARACPVIAPRQPPFTEMIVDGATGLLYETDDVSSALERLRWITSSADRHRTIGIGGRTAAVERCDPDRVAARLVASLNRLAS